MTSTIILCPLKHIKDLWYLLTTIHAATRMYQKSRRVQQRTRGKEQSYFKGVFAEATITGRNNQDSDSAAESDNDDNADDR